MKKIIFQFNIPGMTAQQYDQCWEELVTAGLTNPAGRTHHVAGKQGDNWVVIEIWESEEAFSKFGEILLPIMERAGVTFVPPVITLVHNEQIGLETV